MLGKLALTFLACFVLFICIWYAVNKGSLDEEHKTLKEAVSWITFASLVLAVLMIFLLTIQVIWKIK